MSTNRHQLITIQYEDRLLKDLVLRKISDEVQSINHEILDLVTDMNRIISEINYATGLSAIQVGVPLRLFVVNLNQLPEKKIIAINPKIVKISGPFKLRNEGCLSLPNYKGQVKRRDKLEFTYTTLDDKIMHCKVEGYPAAVFQHEFDHLEGKLYWDRLEPNTELTKFKNGQDS